MSFSVDRDEIESVNRPEGASSTSASELPFAEEVPRSSLSESSQIGESILSSSSDSSIMQPGAQDRCIGVQFFAFGKSALVQINDSIMVIDSCSSAHLTIDDTVLFYIPDTKDPLALFQLPCHVKYAVNCAFSFGAIKLFNRTAVVQFARDWNGNSTRFTSELIVNSLTSESRCFYMQFSVDSVWQNSISAIWIANASKQGIVSARESLTLSLSSEDDSLPMNAFTILAISLQHSQFAFLDVPSVAGADLSIMVNIFPKAPMIGRDKIRILTTLMTGCSSVTGTVDVQYTLYERNGRDLLHSWTSRSVFWTSVDNKLT